MLQTNYLVEVNDDRNPDQVQITGKITDFGLSHVLSSGLDSGNSQISQAFRWQAPELANIADEDVTGRERCMEKADVWSFALTSLEVPKPSPLPYQISETSQIVCNQEPFSDCSSFFKFYDIWKDTNNPERLITMLPTTNPVEDILSCHAFEIMKLCWQYEADDRPHLAEAREQYLSNMAV